MKKRTLIIGAIAATATFAGGWALAQSVGQGPMGFGPPFMRGQGLKGVGPGMMRGMGHGMMMKGMGHGMMGMDHDSATMSQLRDIHALLANHDRIKRTVTNLPDGIRTVTELENPQIAALIKIHVAKMGERVKAGDDPGLPIESPALHSIFRNRDKIRTTYETTAKGIIVVQTSNDPTTVAQLQKHAAEVTDLVQGGMAAIHTAMMRNNSGMMGGIMPGPMMHGGPGGKRPESR